MWVCVWVGVSFVHHSTHVSCFCSSLLPLVVSLCGGRFEIQKNKKKKKKKQIHNTFELVVRGSVWFSEIYQLTTGGSIGPPAFVVWAKKLIFPKKYEDWGKINCMYCMSVRVNGSFSLYVTQWCNGEFCFNVLISLLFFFSSFFCKSLLSPFLSTRLQHWLATASSLMIQWLASSGWAVFRKTGNLCHSIYVANVKAAAAMNSWTCPHSFYPENRKWCKWRSGAEKVKRSYGSDKVYSAL